MMKNIALSFAVVTGLGFAALPALAITPAEFVAAATQRSTELDAQVVLLRSGPQTPAILAQIRALAGTSNQLRSLARIAPRRPPEYLQRQADYYGLGSASPT
jgi:hypothetical protein